MDISQVKINIKLIMKNSVEQSGKADKVRTRVRKHEANFASLNVIALISVKQHFIMGFFFLLLSF